MTAGGADWIGEEDRRAELQRTHLVARLAVLGAFDPARVDHDDLPGVLRLCARKLTSVSEGHDHWMLTESARIAAFTSALKHGGLAELASLRREAEPHFKDALQDMLDAWVLDGRMPPLIGLASSRATNRAELEGQLAAYTHVHRWATAALQAAGHSPSNFERLGPSIDEVEGELSLLEVTRPVRWLVRHPVVGREEELGKLRAYLNQPGTGSLSRDPAYAVYGIGGIGKSTLVAAFVTELIEGKTGRTPWAYLDFDRRVLNPYEPSTIVSDIYRQIGAQYPEFHREVEHVRIALKSGSRGAGLESFDSSMSPRGMALELTLLARRVAPKLVVVLDTCEEMQRISGAAERVHELFDAIASAHGDLKLVVSGRSRVPEFERSDRPDRIMAVGELQKLFAIQFLEAQIARALEKDAPLIHPAIAADVVELVGGNPLTLSIAARVLAHDNMTAISSTVRRAEALGRVRDEIVRGFLYGRVLNHLQGSDPERRPVLRQIARASLVLRYLTPDLISTVLSPISGAEAASAHDIYADLAMEVGFVEDKGSALRLREDVRGPALEALRLEDAALVENVHAAAKRYYGERLTLPGARVEHLYHSLALGHHSALYDVTSDELGELLMTRVGLPRASIETLESLHKTENVRERLAEEEELHQWERSVLETVDSLLRGGDLAGARQLLFQRPARTPASELHRLESRLLEAEGDLGAAADASAADLAASRSGAHGDRFGAAALRLAGLLERLTGGDEALQTLEAAQQDPLLRGNVPVCMQLLLNRMTTAERTGAWDDEQRWLPSLEAREYVRKLGSRIDQQEAIVRLLAAALGRDEPSYLKQAAQRVGLGTETASHRIDALAKALAAWAAASHNNLASLASLPTGNVDEWRRRVGALGIEAGELIVKLWATATPPREVTEALRELYLWWGVPFGTHRPDGAIHFLDEFPLNHGRTELRQLTDAIAAALGSVEEAKMVAAYSGLSLDYINFQQALVFVVRDLLSLASTRGRMRELLRKICDIGGSVATRIRRVVGDEWLTERARA